MNFDSLVNEILRMAKDSADERKKRAEGNANISWDNTPAGEAYWKDIRARNAQIETGRQTDLGTLARQRLINEGAANVADITGRAGIAGDEIKAGAHRYAADQSLEAAKYTAGAKDKSLSNLLKTDGATPGEVAPEDVRAFDRTDAAPIRTNTPSGAPTMDFRFTGRTGLGPSENKTETLEQKRKKQEELLLYGTKPQKRSWLSSL